MEDIITPIISWQVLELLGCGNQIMLVAACDKRDENNNVTKKILKDSNEYEQATVLQHRTEVYHSSKSV